jgi:sigma-B regulation protein RsbU (phosphoserine phosphatase)
VLYYALSDPQVSYHLDGFDSADTTVSRSKLTPVNYTNLSGGSYSFVLKADDKEIAVALDKDKTIFEQPLFWVAAVLIFLLADAWFIRWVLRRQARRIEEKKEQERIANELDMAREIQVSALPQTFPAFPDRDEFDLFASMTPAKEVGGDFYDFFMTDKEHLALVIADVSGKGIPSALFMMTSKTLIRNELMTGCDPATALERVNAQLREQNSSGMFVTVWLAVLEISTGKGLVCNAGHEHPAIRHAGGEFELLKYPHCVVVGALKRAKYRNREFELRPGDCVFVYTDGVPEATNAAKEMFGTERLVDALNQNADANPEELAQIVKETVNGFVGDAPQFDDLTMLCFRMNR